jgi:hypothetical protein
MALGLLLTLLRLVISALDLAFSADDNRLFRRGSCGHAGVWRPTLSRPSGFSD